MCELRTHRLLLKNKYLARGSSKLTARFASTKTILELLYYLPEKGILRCFVNLHVGTSE